LLEEVRDRSYLLAPADEHVDLFVKERDKTSDRRQLTSRK
jgi:hypothetical protein